MKFSRLAILATLPLLCSCEPINRYFKVEDDNLIETISEDIIKSEVGISLDLTPSNPDNDSYNLDIRSKD